MVSKKDFTGVIQHSPLVPVSSALAYARIASTPGLPVSPPAEIHDFGTFPPFHKAFYKQTYMHIIKQ